MVVATFGSPIGFLKPMSGFPETRESLILRIKDSEDGQAWEDFLGIYQPVIYRIARTKGLQEADAQDLAQAVLVSVATAVRRWEPGPNRPRFRNWLSHITRNAILKAFARRPRSDLVGGAMELDELTRQDGGSDSAILELIETEYRRQMYLRASSIVRTDVTAESWQIFEMTAIDGISIADVAQELGKTVGSIYAVRSRVMHRLRRAIRELEESEQ